MIVGFEYRPLTEREKLRYGTRDQQDKLLAEAEPVILKALRSEGLDGRNPVSARNRVSELLTERLAQRTGEPGKDEFQHASWLAMIKSRLRLAQAMLAGDGSIFVSIDDHEVEGLRYLLDALFEPPNFIAQLVWEKERKNDAKRLSVQLVQSRA